MKSVKKHNLISRLTLSSIAFLFFFTINLSAQGDAANGKKLYNSNCAACHKLDKNVVGPALGGITEKRENAWLKSWIKDNAAFQKVDADAKEAAKFSPASMTAFPQLSDKEIDDILAFTTAPPAKKVAKKAETSVATANDQKGEEKGSVLNYILGALAFVLALIAFNLYRTVSVLKGESDGEKSPFAQNNGIWEAFKANKFLHFLIVIFFLLLGAWLAFGWMFQVGVNQGYQPVQPIKFSHKIHAGDNKIDCQYCHSSAKHSKTSGIPSANVCMNCHKNTSEVAEDTKIVLDGVTYGKDVLDDEIQKKLYKAVGWDADKLTYTGETQPIEWIRVHDLADFVYYNHSQHVTVAGFKCQKCHGPIEEMDEVYQFSPLTMGWCIECHKESEIDMTKNGYYKKIHEQLAEKYGVEHVTEAQMGGMECGKCHY